MREIMRAGAEHPLVAEAMPQDEERRDFSELGPEIAISYLFSELRDPAHSEQRGLELSATIVSLTTAENPKDITSHKARLEELIDESPIYTDDALWNKKSEGDVIFRLLVDALRSNQGRDRQGNSLNAQRAATRRLLSLRGTFPELRTVNDPEWENILERLFS